MMECLNHFAPAIQALTAFFILCLTLVLVFLTNRYVQVSEALQKPCIALASGPLGGDGAVLETPFVTEVSQQEGRVVIRNVGTGPAINLRFGFRHTNAEPGAPVIHITEFVDYVQPGQQWRTQVARQSLSTRHFDFEADYESLSGKKHKTKIFIEDGRIKSFDFK
jgi:hypothetical protein